MLKTFWTQNAPYKLRALEFRIVKILLKLDCSLAYEYFRDAYCFVKLMPAFSVIRRTRMYESNSFEESTSSLSPGRRIWLSLSLSLLQHYAALYRGDLKLPEIMQSASHPYNGAPHCLRVRKKTYASGNISFNRQLCIAHAVQYTHPPQGKMRLPRK